LTVRIVTDSTADLGPDQARKLGITIVPLTVFFGDQAYRDGVDLDNQRFYSLLATSKAMPRTSQPAVTDFEAAYRHAFGEGVDAILSVHISAALSGTFNAASLAAETVRAETGKRIEVVDSRLVSLALGLPLIAVARAAQDGRSLDELTSMVHDRLARVRLIAVLDTLEFLQRGGRIGRAQQLLGTLLNVKPLVTVRDGVVVPLGKARTRAKAYEQVVELVSKLGPLEELAIAESNAEVGEQLGAALKAVASRPLDHYRLGAVLGTHAGPGAVAAVALVQR
jgi:DegV family protein with EDD domain